MFDIIIKGATIVDGTGSEPFIGDVAVCGEKIVEVGILENAEAEKIIDGQGRVLTPGFIDVHSHGDAGTIVNPPAECKIRQGITTHIVGNCGGTPFPLRGYKKDEWIKYAEDHEIEITWDDAEGYLEALGKAKPSINTATFVGHSTIRAAVMGERDMAPTLDQMNEMKREVDKALDAGALGMSTGLIYKPGLFSTEEELSELMKRAAGRGGMYASHIRGEGDTLLSAIKEALNIGMNASCSVQIAHLKASAPRNWGKVKNAIDMIEKAKSSGLDVRFDKYPYTAGSTSLDTYLPRWTRGDGIEKMIEFLSDPETRDKIFEESDQEHDGAEKWASVIITSAECDEYRPYEGLNLVEIAEKTGMTVKNVFAEILIKSRAMADIVCFTQSQEDTDLALLHPLGLVCTDSGVWAPYGPLSRVKPHPRAYGTFPRFLNRYVKEEKKISMPEAVQKITKLSAERFNLKNRGVIRKDYYADLVLINWDKLKDTATYTEPHSYPEGIWGVFVNGRTVLLEGRRMGEGAGHVLRRTESGVC